MASQSHYSVWLGILLGCSAIAANPFPVNGTKRLYTYKLYNATTGPTANSNLSSAVNQAIGTIEDSTKSIAISIHLNGTHSPAAGGTLVLTTTSIADTVSSSPAGPTVIATLNTTRPCTAPIHPNTTDNPSTYGIVAATTTSIPSPDSSSLADTTIIAIINTTELPATFIHPHSTENLLMHETIVATTTLIASPDSSSLMDPTIITIINTTQPPTISIHPNGTSDISIHETFSATSTLVANLSPSHASNPTTNITQSPAEPTLSGTKMFLALAALAGNAIQQRSGADEFPCPDSLSLARASPLICAADILVAAMTLAYGLIKGKGFRRSCALYVRNSRRHVPAPVPLLSGYRMVIHFGFFALSMLAAVQLFAAQGIAIRILVWASMYAAAPVVSAIMRMAAEGVEAGQDDNEVPIAAQGEPLLWYSDVIWCAAYVCQFTLWIQVFDAFSTLPRYTEPSSKWMNVGICCSISVAVLLSAICTSRFYMFWCLRNWQRAQWFVCSTVGFVLSLVVGMPTDTDSIRRLRHTCMVPLGAFSVVVNMLWLVTLTESSLACLLRALRQGWRSAVGHQDRPEDIDPELRDRINPLLSTAPEWWRRTLMLNFACCQIFFAALNFILLENDTGVTLPSWASPLSR